ncbi:MAG TPA: ABC transporter permease, partial [Spirochaetota bacterium]|nr:ABC transporter permease [Spirochaetota bacterium]
MPSGRKQISPSGLSAFLRFTVKNVLTKESAIVFIPLCAAWELLPRAGILPRSLFPTLSDVLRSFADLVMHHSLATHFVSSMTTFSIGFMIAIFTAVPIGVLMGWNRVVKSYSLPLFQILAPVPPTAWIPVTILVFGIGLPMKIFLVFLGAFYPILFNTFQSVKDTDHRFITAARVYGASEFTLITHIHIRCALGGIIMSIRTGVVLALVMLTAAEMYGDRSGIGFLLIESKEYFRIPA